MALTALTLPEMLTGIEPGNFGAYEHRWSHYGGVNLFYNNTKKLFDPKTLAKIRNTPYTKVVKIPILNNYIPTVLTVRTCTITIPTLTPTLKTITRVHMAVDMGINMVDYEDSYVTEQQSLSQQYEMSRKEILKQLDIIACATLDTNKDTVVNSWDANHPLYIRSAGAYQMPGSKPEDFFINLPTIMEEMDVQPPYWDISSTIGLADRLRLQNPGGGATLDTANLLKQAGLQEVEHTNRIARGSNRTVHYVGPIGSIGMINFIDKVYRDAPELGSAADMAQWDKFGNASDFKMWSHMSDDLYPDWKWGVLQSKICVDENIQYAVKMSADFAFVTDFTSTGASPIKRFEMANLVI